VNAPRHDSEIEFDDKCCIRAPLLFSDYLHRASRASVTRWVGCPEHAHRSSYRSCSAHQLCCVLLHRTCGPLFRCLLGKRSLCHIQLLSVCKTVWCRCLISQARTWGSSGLDDVYQMQLDPSTASVYATGTFEGTVAIGSNKLTSNGGRDIWVSLSRSPEAHWGCTVTTLFSAAEQVARFDSRDGSALWCVPTYLCVCCPPYHAQSMVVI
jgi:hypothetical protein